MIPESLISVLNRARQLAPQAEAEGRKLGVVSSFNPEPLRPWIITASSDSGYLLHPWFAPFGQLEQVVLADNNGPWAASDVLLVLARPGDLDQRLGLGIDSLEAGEREARLHEVTMRLVSLAREARNRFSGAIMIANFSSDEDLLDAFDGGRADGVRAAVAQANRALAVALGEVPDTYVFDHAAVVGEIGAAHVFDPRLFARARIAIAAEAQPRYARRLVRTVVGILFAPAKCLVVDLDQTLWGGVLGDDGPRGLHLGSDGEGLAFRRFQQALQSLQRRGLLLAIASKNDLAAVLDLLDSHPEMVLRRDDFAVIEANFEAKSKALRRIAQALNIACDALVFLDDNPVECAEVNANLPEVRVVQLPADPFAYVAQLREIPLLDRPRVSSEDRQRSGMFTAERKRREVAGHAGSVSDFLRDLQMKVEVGLLDETTFARVHQLLHKTNQFNLTTRRYSEEELRRLEHDARVRVVWLRLSDRFGDSGLVAVGIVSRKDEGSATIDALLMSCRVMNRGAEDALLSEMAQLARDLGAQRLMGSYVRTAKNGIVENFYPAHGFSVIDRSESATRYEFDLTQVLAWPAQLERARETL